MKDGETERKGQRYVQKRINEKGEIKRKDRKKNGTTNKVVKSK
jgi:hypothetical protein